MNIEAIAGGDDYVIFAPEGWGKEFQSGNVAKSDPMNTFKNWAIETAQDFLAKGKRGVFLVNGHADGLKDPLYFRSSPLWAAVGVKAGKMVEVPL